MVVVDDVAFRRLPGAIAMYPDLGHVDELAEMIMAPAR